MKRFLSTLTLLLCFAFTAVNAQVITAERAAEIANSFFSAGVQKSAAARGVVSSPSLTSSFDSNDVTETASAEPTFYVLTNPEGGFVIVSGEETENPIIGYSLDGTIDVNNLPDGFVGYMTDIDAQVKSLREYNTNNPQKAAAARSAMQRTNYNATSMGNIQVLLETAKWGQGSPFNTLCFTDATHTTNAKTGCVPTAFAIVMRYHKWPEEGIGKLVDFQLSTSEYIYITDRTYDWDNMPLVYDGNWSDYQINEVAKVMRDLGQAYMVDYGKNETGVSVPGNSGKLETYFNYNYVSGVSQAEAGSIDNWKTRIKESLDNNCPIPYKSHNSASGSDTNHMFVLDGYTDNDYYHFNWGWSGSGNGWYQLTLMNPSGSDYSWGTSSDQLAIFNLTPKKTKRTVTVSANPAGAGSVTVNGSANSAEVIEGTTATLDATANDGYTFSYWSKGGVQVSTEKTYKAPVAAEGNVYVANFLTVSSTRVNVSVSYNSSYGTVTQKNGSTISGTGLTPYQNSEVTLVATPLDGYVFNGWTVTKGTNSTNYSGTELTFVATENMSVEARFSLAVSDYTISTSNITKSDYRQGSSSYCSTWTTADGIILSATKGSEKAYALSASNPLLYARATTESSTETAVNEITFTLTAPDGYILLSYDIFCYCNGSYTIDATPEGGNTITINRADDHTISASGINAKSARFVLSSSNGNAAIRFDSFTVRLQSEGGGSTPTPDPTPTTYTIYATAGEGGSVTINGDAVSQKSVNENSTVTLVATPQAGYCFVNWTKDGVEVSAEASYTFNATADGEYVANFEQIVVNAILTDAQGNTYNVKLSGFTTGITTAIVAAKLTAKYPYITLGDNAALNGSNAAYTYSNKVTLPFKVSSVSDATKTYWYNIYYPSNGDDRNPNYLATLNEDEVVDMAASKDYAYGDNPTYNTKDGGNSICWAIYNVNNSFEFIFKSRVTNKYIKVESVSSSTTENVKFVENAEDATAFTLLAKETVDLTGVYPAVTGDCDFALVANIDETTGYLCATSSDKDYVTHFDRYNHRGAWVKFVEAPDYFSKIMDMGTMLGYRFGAGDSKCVIAGTDIEEVDNAMQNSGSITLNKLNDYAARMEAAMATENPTWFNVKTSAENGAAYIILENDDPELTSKRVPGSYELTVKATPATGYHFTGWTMNGTAIEGDNDEHTFTVTEATTIVASFAINTYTVSLTAGEGGSASASETTVEHGSEVTLTAHANDGYEFAGWYDGENLISADANYTFTVTSDINYTARFEEEAGETPTTVAIHITVASTDGTPVTNAVDGNVKAVINNVGMGWCTEYDFKANADVELVAIHDHNESAYLFDGWYKNDVLVNKAPEITVKATEAATYEARFSLGRVITLASSSKTWGYPNIITYENGDPVAGTATKLRAVVRDNERLLISINPNYGYRVANWTDKNGNEVAGKNANSFILTVNGDNNYTANLERATYTLTVRANNEGGTVSAESVAGGSGTEIIVGHNMEATITASPYPGHRFVEWTTTDGTPVSDEKTYTVPAIENVEDMVDVEYVAVFEEIGTYYRIAYNFEVPVETPAKSAATRAVGDVVTYPITPANGTPKPEYGDISQWTFTKDGYPAGLTLKATSGGTLVKSIWIDGNYLDLATGGYPQTGGSSINNVTYTLSVQNSNYRIVGYEIECKTNSTVTFTPNSEKLTSSYKVYGEEFEPVTEKTFSFESDKVTKLTVNCFNVYIQEVGGGETPEPETETVKYYVQSEACGVSGKENALKMTTVNDNASSIFYCVGNKLMSYAKGTYVNENGDTRGLQNVGVEVGKVTFESNKIKFTNGTNVAYMHAKESNGIYYVDNCGATATCGNDDHNFIFEVVESLPVTISAAGYASWYAPVAVELPEDDVEAWYFKGDITKVGDVRYAIMAPIGGNVVPANTGVILKDLNCNGKESNTYELTITTEKPDYADKVKVQNKLEGTVATEYVAKDAYVLSKPNGKDIGFYSADMNKQNNTAFQNNSHKAYLPAINVPGDALQSAGFRFSFGGTTDIEEVETESSEVNAIYDLTGRKLEGISGTGIYIINGKKVIVK